jgi:alanine racemase
VDLGAIRANAARILEHLPGGTRLFAVVKAGGYGHGAVRAARAALDGGATHLAVATLPEARELEGLVTAERILVMGGLTTAQAGAAAASGCALAVSSLELAQELARSERVVPVHLKVDTGMGRFGASPEEAPPIARFIEQSDGLQMAGVWSHFASADSDVQMTRRQFETFGQVLGAIGPQPGLRHIANSAAARHFPEYALDAVRCGISLYGCEWPGAEPALSLHALVTHVKTVRPGDTVGYGATWRARETTRVATVAIGYADGVHRIRSNRGHVLIRGRRAPLIGTVSMDAVTADVSGIEGAQVGDTATLIGRDGEDKITAEEVGRWSGTISYEVLTSLGPRVERVYRNS